MRKLLAVLTVALLPGCAIVDAYLMTKYDPNEYRLATEIRVDARQYKEQCATPHLAPTNAQALASKTDLFAAYEENIPRNENGIKASKALNEIAQGLAAAYRKPEPVSQMFCKIKYGSIEHSAELIQHTLGNRPR